MEEVLTPMAIGAIEKILGELKAGRLEVSKISIVDDSVLSVAFECSAPRNFEEVKTNPGIPSQIIQKKQAFQSGCPKCGSQESVEVSNSERCCLKCSHNWSPKGEKE